MQTIRWRGLPLSRMMLGTVQFGLPYGVANQTGQPRYEEVVRIIATAFEGGVRCFDTAAAYGTSEEVLGKALRELRIADQVTVVTKVMPVSPEESVSVELASAAIERSIEQSRQRLHLDTLSVVLFHREVDAVHLDALLHLRDRGWVREVGVSCDNRPGPAETFVGSAKVAALQIPANLVDRRHAQSGIFELAHEREMAVFVRSVYLQGLLLMPEEQIPAPLCAIIPARRRLIELAQEAGLSLSEMAVRYMLEHRGVTSVIVGVETVEQVKDNIASFERPSLSGVLQQALDAWTWNLTEMILTPSQWPARA